MTQRWKTFILQIILGAILSSCAVDAHVMNQMGYDSIALGTEITMVERTFGPAYEINSLPTGDKEYVFIERIFAGDGRVDQNTYVLHVSLGRVVGKRCENVGQALNIEWR